MTITIFPNTTEGRAAISAAMDRLGDGPHRAALQPGYAERLEAADRKLLGDRFVDAALRAQKSGLTILQEMERG